MEIENLSLMISQLIVYWKKQNITISSMTFQEVTFIEKYNFLKLPNDFKELYTRANGMDKFYLDEFDEEGFLFYPIEEVVSTSVSPDFKKYKLINKEQTYLFAEYMHKSWYYAFKITENDEYIIGIIAYMDIFKPITNLLAEFIRLYIEDSPILYDYE